MKYILFILLMFSSATAQAQEKIEVTKSTGTSSSIMIKPVEEVLMDSIKTGTPAVQIFAIGTMLKQDYPIAVKQCLYQKQYNIIKDEKNNKLGRRYSAYRNFPVYKEEK